MRSVVVVLPASMCAMMPMLRVFSRLVSRGMGAVLTPFAMRYATARSAPHKRTSRAGDAGYESRHEGCLLMSIADKIVHNVYLQPLGNDGWDAERKIDKVDVSRDAAALAQEKRIAGFKYFFQDSVEVDGRTFKTDK